MALVRCTQVTDSIGPDVVRAIVPDSYNAVYGAHQIQVHHGLSDDNNSPNAAVSLALSQAMLDEGYIITSSDAGFDSCGNAASVTAMAGLDTWARGLYAIRRSVLWAGSFGGISALLTAKNGTVRNLAAVIMLFPVCDLLAIWNAITLQSYMKAAYGIASDGSDYATKTAGSDPFGYAAELFPRVPFRLYASAGDSVVSKTAHADAFATRMRAFLQEITVVPCTGDHGDASHFQPSDTIPFVRRSLAHGWNRPASQAGNRQVSAGGNWQPDFVS